MEEYLTITIQIAERDYTVRVNREDEQVFRQASLLIKNAIQGYATKKSYRDKQDLLSMVLLQYVISYLNESNKSKSFDEQTLNKISEINDYLSSHVE